MENVIFIKAWSKNTPPKTRGQFNAMIPMTVGDTPGLVISIYWNWVKQYYEAEIKQLLDDGEYYKRIELHLSLKVYCAFKRYMRNLGVKHYINVYCNEKPQKSRPSTLPDIFNPTIV